MIDRQICLPQSAAKKMFDTCAMSLYSSLVDDDEGDDAERVHYGPYATRAEAEAKMAECLAKDESAESAESAEEVQ